jgi:adenylate kinase family enzyme
LEIYALIGHSGTGKSHQAPLMAKKYNIEYIVDDGLLIKGNDILAGRSAKRENTRYGAIKRALFKDQEHAQQLKDKLAEVKPGRLLILSTSRRMADIIAQNIGLDNPSYYFTIEEVSDPESIKAALAIRSSENRHVIPLPTFAIKKDFPGYIIDPLRSFFSLPQQHSGSPFERSVVRPIYSTSGSFFIAEHVILELIEYIVDHFKGVYKVLYVDIDSSDSKVYLHIDIALDLKKVPDQKIDLLLRDIQKTVKSEIEYQTGFYLDQVNINAKKIHLEPDLFNSKKL